MSGWGRLCWPSGAGISETHGSGAWKWPAAYSIVGVSLGGHTCSAHMCVPIQVCACQGVLSVSMHLRACSCL